MPKVLCSLVAVGFLSLPIGASLSAQAPAPSAAAPSVDEALKAYRNDLQGARADIMAKNLTLTADQAAKFWPAYAKFQAEQAVIVDAQLQAAKQFVEGYATMTDAAALAVVNAHLARDLQMNTLRKTWLAEFQKILPARLAARAIQIDRRLGLAAQLSLSSELPLVY